MLRPLDIIELRGGARCRVHPPAAAPPAAYRRPVNSVNNNNNNWSSVRLPAGDPRGKVCRFEVNNKKTKHKQIPCTSEILGLKKNVQWLNQRCAMFRTVTQQGICAEPRTGVCVSKRLSECVLHFCQFLNGFKKSSRKKQSKCRVRFIHSLSDQPHSSLIQVAFKACGNATSGCLELKGEGLMLTENELFY